MKDWVDMEGIWEVKFVGNRRNLLGDVIWSNELMLEFLGRSQSLGGKVDVVCREHDLVSNFEGDITVRLVCISFLIGFGQDKGICGNLGRILERF